MSEIETVPNDLLEKTRKNGNLSTLNPVSRQDVQKVLTEFPGLPAQYLSFIHHIGIGETKNGLLVYLPHRADMMVEHPSYKIYNSDNSRKLFGNLFKPKTIPQSLVCISDSMASWRYCVELDGSSEVFCLSLAGPEIDPEAADFYAFIREHCLSDD